MIQVEVRLHDARNDALPEILETVRIANDGTGTRERGNYRVWVAGLFGSHRPAAVRNWDRSRPAVQLVREALNALAEKNGW